jgi:hypothetical protein
MTNLHILMFDVTHQGRTRTGCNGRSKSCQRFALSLSARSDCRFRSPYPDASEETMSDRSDSDFIQRPSSTLTGRSGSSEPVIEID